MKKLMFDKKSGKLKIVIEQTEDFWYLKGIIDQGDVVEGVTTRKISLGGEGEKSSSVRKTCYVFIRTEEVEYTEEDIRISGTITGGDEELPRGSYHTLRAGLHDTVTITKTHWSPYHEHVLKESTSGDSKPILLCVHDREEAYIAKTNKTGYDILLHLEGEVEKKNMDARAKDFYKEVKDEIMRYMERHKCVALLLASPAFFKEDLAKIMPKELLSKTVFATTSSVTKNGVEELLKRPEAKEALKSVRASEELNIVEKIFEGISKNGKACYGKKETMQAIDSGAVVELVIGESFVKTIRKEDPKGFEDMLRKVEKGGGTLHFISEEHDGGKRLKGIGGIAALLRYKMFDYR